MKLSELNLLSLQTKFMQDDLTTQGFCAALDTPMKSIANSIKYALLWHNYDNLSEDVLDFMALSLNIPWYDSEADIETKRHIIENSDMVYLFLGTKKAIELVFEAWGVTAYILEWFNYSGDPYHYKIVIDYTYYAPVYDVDGNELYDVDGNRLYAPLDVPFLPDGALITKLTALLPLLQPVRCVCDSITTTAAVTQNTVADVNALGIVGGLKSRYVWDLKYQI